jgi:hypothetical protein
LKKIFLVFLKIFLVKQKSPLQNKEVGILGVVTQSRQSFFLDGTTLLSSLYMFYI